jgi:hypothetical protein
MRTFLTAFGSLIVFGLVVISIFANFWFGTLLISGQERFIYGAIFGLLDALKTVLIPVAGFAWTSGAFARARTAYLIFALLTVLSFCAEIGLYAISKSEAVGDAKSHHAAFHDATAERDAHASRLAALGQSRSLGAIEADISAKRLDRLYDRSKQCTDATATESRELCQAIERLNAERAIVAEAKELQGKLDGVALRLSKMNAADAFKSVDPQAEALAKLTGLDPESVRLLLAILIATLIEMGSGLGFWLMSTEAAREPLAAVAKPRKAKPADASRQIGDTHESAELQRACVVERWSNEALTRRRGAHIVPKDARAIFEAWCGERDLEPVNPTAFGKAMTRLGYKRSKVGGAMRYEGVALRGVKTALVAVK